MLPVTDVSFRRSVIVAHVWIVCLFLPVLGTLTLHPEGTVAHYVQGETAILTCRTTLEYPVLWQYSKDLKSARHNVFRRGLVINGFRNRTAADLTVPNTYTIEIRDLQLSDSGIYRCLEDDGIGPDEKYVEVIVHEELTTVASPVERQQETNSYLASIADKPSSQGGGQQGSYDVIVIVSIVCASVVLVVIVVVALVALVVVWIIRRRHIKAHVPDDTEKALNQKIYRPQGQTPLATIGESNSLTASDGSQT